MKIFRKIHFWKDNRTFIELEAEEPRIERDYPIEGSFFLKIGEQSTIKSAFKLNPDEARALRDAIDMHLKVHDKKMSELMRNDYEKKEYTQSYSREEYSAPKPEYSRPEPEKPSYSDDYSPGPFPKKEYNKEEYTFKPEYGREDYQKPEYTKMPESKPKDSFFIFGSEEQPKKEEPKKPNVEFYF